MSEVRIERMRPGQIVAARQRCAVAYLALGAIEWHGQHNPLGLDGLKAHALCARAAQTGGGVVFPTLWYGEHREIQLVEANPTTREAIATAMELPPDNFSRGYMRESSVSHRTNAYLDLLTHCFHQIRSMGYRVLYVLCGHYPLRAYADLAGQAFSRDTATAFHAAAEHELVHDLPLADRIGDHAGAWETSLLMHLEPGLVDLDEVESDAEQSPLGVIGRHPREASQDLGYRATQAITDRMVQRAMSLLNETTG